MSGLGLEATAQFVAQARQSAGEGDKPSLPQNRLSGPMSLLASWTIHDLVSNSASPASDLDDGFRDLPREKRTHILGSARNNLQNSTRLVAELIGALLPALESTLGATDAPSADDAGDIADAGASGLASRFNKARNTVLVFAASLPVINLPFLPVASELAQDRLVVQGIGATNRVADASSFADFATDEDVARAVLRIDHERSNTLRRVHQRFLRSLNLIEYWLARPDIADGTKPDGTTPSPRLTFPGDNPQSFHASFAQRDGLVGSSGVGSYDQGIRIAGQAFHFGDPRGQRGNRSI